MSSIMRARSALTGRSEEWEVIEASSLKPKVAGPSMLGIGCPDRHVLPLTPAENAWTVTHASSRESGFVLGTHNGRTALAAGTALPVKGFGCRPVVTYPRVLRAGVRKPPGKEPAVGGAGGGGRWRFDGAAARASDALSDGVGGGSTIATVGALRRRSPTTCGTATASWSATGTSRHTHSALG